MIKNTLLIFDCFGVITSEIAPVWFASRYSPEEAANLKEMYFFGADRGEISINELIDNLSDGLNIPRQTIISEWESLFSINDHLIDLIGKLRVQHSIALLSNAPRGLVEVIFEKYGLGNLFDKIFISSHYNMAKPDKEFYKLCKDAFPDAKQVYMIDDNPKNLEGLEALNIKKHLFTSNEALIHYLHKEKLL